MGASTSKPETKVFTPSTPVDFSASFLSHLENTTESDYSRSQYTEKYIQERVALELAKLEEKVKKEFAETADKALLKNTESGLSVPKINDKIQKLNDVLKANAELAKVDLSEEVKNSRNEVIKCLKENEGKSLNCWNEVENFKRVVKDL